MIRKRKFSVETLERREVLAAAMLADLNSAGSVFEYYLEAVQPVAVGENVFVGKFHSDYGKELWKIDAESRVTMVKDLDPGPRSSNPDQFVKVNGVLVFRATAPWRSVWSSDGTEEGTIQLAQADIIDNLVPFAGGALFTAKNLTTGASKVWQTDGTIEGTIPVDDAEPDTRAAAMKEEVALHGFAFFVSDTAKGKELWRTNLTDEIVRVSATSLPNPEARFGSDFYYFEKGINESDEPSWQLWKTDGTPGEIQVIHNNLSSDSELHEHNQPFGLTNLNGKLLFAADRDEYLAWSLWTSDGTIEGTSPTFNFYYGNFFPSHRPESFAVLGNFALFFANEGLLGTEVWKSDGTAEGTELVRELNPGQYGSEPYPYNNRFDAEVGPDGDLYFSAYSPSTGASLWKSDGTTQGTQIVADFTSELAYFHSAVNFTLIQGSLYFYVVQDDFHQGVSLWKIDTEADNPQRIATLDSRTYASGTVSVATTDNLYFFENYSSNYDNALYAVDVRTGSLEYLGPHENIGRSAVVDSTVYFVQREDISFNLWKSDGTFGGTQLVTRITAPATSSSSIEGFTSALNHVFFVELTGVGPRRILWKSDGTSAGTVPVDELPLLENGYGRVKAIPSSDKYLFRLLDEAELWASDGTAEGTRRIHPEHLYIDENLFAEVNGTMYFVAYAKAEDDSLGDPQLWSYELASGNVQLAFDLEIELRSLVATSEKLYLSDGDSLWVSDGTLDGTRLLGAGGLDHLTAIGQRVYFFDLPEFGRMTLWTSDGTDSGTRLLGQSWAFNDHILEHLGGALFISMDQFGRSQFTITDGTLEGTMPLGPADDLYSGADIETSIGDHLILRANDSFHSSELWRYSPSIPESPLQNKLNRLDVNNDSEVRPQDILLMVDEMRRNGVRGLEEGVAPDWFVDVNGDNRFTPQDILLLVDYLNRRARYQYFPSSNDETMSELLASGEAAAEEDSFAAEALYQDIALGIASTQAESQDEASPSRRSRSRLASVH